MGKPNQLARLVEALDRYREAFERFGPLVEAEETKASDLDSAMERLMVLWSRVLSEKRKVSQGS